ncbi:MAG: 4-hydroxy-3-methylbut-2-en-yl diphosphate synthase [Bacteroidota bacterium]|jgi:(E)-4-hydroxy-3-methylbut-2-enyl-diphosphate synthase
MSSGPYCPNLYRYERYHTRAVKVGETSIGGENPIRLQSMTTTDTMDTEATVAQSVRMIEAGCELVRITAPSKDEAINLGPIRDALRNLGHRTPLVADIHFTPNAAEIAAGIVEKVRVNPGNYADKKKFEEIEYTDESYAAELDRIRQRFTPLVLLCKQHGTAMRIGTNHGSLSDRILSRYGDTPRGMVESAMEFIRICRDLDFHELVISMKASNPQVMVQAYRMLVWHMMREGMNYPLHLGVTEAGDGLDGRIKSAVGIGALLEDGLGDTIRVSLTEEPEAEIPVAKMLADRYAKRTGSPVVFADERPATNPFEYERRHTLSVRDIGGKNVPRVIADLSGLSGVTPASLFAYGLHYSVPLDKWNILDQAADYIYCGKSPVEFEIPGTLGIIYDFETWQDRADQVRAFPLLTVQQYMKAADMETTHFVSLPVSLISQEVIEKLKSDHHAVAILESAHEHAMPDMRAAFFHLMNQDCEVPVIIKREYAGTDQDEFMLYASTDAGSLLLDGLGDGLWLNAESPVTRQSINETAFGILQATRTRISKTEYISCPSCGRTLFDLQETTAKIRSRTSHLKGVKIGIMGCIVNGPGEMADADYGYVGTGVGKITLYKEKEVVKRNIPEEQAVDELIALIREHGDWVEPAMH